MEDKLLDYRIAEKIKKQLALEVELLKHEGFRVGLSVILVGDNPASKVYVANKERTCKELGIESETLRFPENTTEKQLLEVIYRLNNDNLVHGILVQLPLPKHIDEKNIIEVILPSKDVDGFHPLNTGKLMNGQDTFFPCTPYGIIKMLESIENFEIEGKHAVIVGRSNIVGKPIGQLLLNRNATVTYVHSKTKEIEKHTKQADILVVAVGKEAFITSKHVKEGAVVIDVGINRNKEGKLCGDVNFDEVKDIASFITPVPKGVGAMTIAMLMYNTVKAAKNSIL